MYHKTLKIKLEKIKLIIKSFLDCDRLSQNSRANIMLNFERKYNTMKRTITMSELKNTGVNTWSVKDNSVRGITTKYTSEIKIGDKVVIDNYFTEVIEG
jgi:hypothetical protein